MLVMLFKLTTLCGIMGSRYVLELTPLFHIARPIIPPGTVRPSPSPMDTIVSRSASGKLAANKAGKAVESCEISIVLMAPGQAAGPVKNADKVRSCAGKPFSTMLCIRGMTPARDVHKLTGALPLSPHPLLSTSTLQ